MKFNSVKNIYRYFLVYLLFIIVGCSNDDNDPSIDEGGEIAIPAEDKLPLITVNTNGLTIVDEPKIDADMTIAEADVIIYTGKIGYLKDWVNDRLAWLDAEINGL